MLPLPMPIRRRSLLAVLALAPSAFGSAQAASIDAPNFIPISETLATSGQPTVAGLRALKAHGFDAAVYLAPLDVPGAVADEPALLAEQGLEFVHIPIPFGKPAPAHLDELASALDRLRGRKVLVHCEINMRASTMVFLYRTIYLKEPPATAYESVARVWSPRGVWRRLVVDELARHHIEFDPY